VWLLLMGIIYNEEINLTGKCLLLDVIYKVAFSVFAVQFCLKDDSCKWIRRLFSGIVSGGHFYSVGWHRRGSIHFWTKRNSTEPIQIQCCLPSS
jgi:hypothetical protein